MTWADAPALALLGYVVWQIPTLIDDPGLDLKAVAYRLIRTVGAFIGALYLIMAS